MRIRELQYDEVFEIEHFSPKEWNFDIVSFMHLHWGKKYFRAIAVEIDGRIVGIANSIINANVGWLGNIIVLDGYRRRGLGKEITQHLIDYLKQSGCTSQILIATEMGKPLYEKLGFKVSSFYAFLKGRKLSFPDYKFIRRLSKEDVKKVYELDKIATGEQRRLLLDNYLNNGWVFKSEENQKIEGFYLPDFGHGLVIAITSTAGLSLLQLKHALYDSSAVLPVENTTGIEFFKDHGFVETKKAPRMYLGKETTWKPQMIYSRASGYSG